MKTFLPLVFAALLMLPAGDSSASPIPALACAHDLVGVSITCYCDGGGAADDYVVEVPYVTWCPQDSLFQHAEDVCDDYCTWGQTRKPDHKVLPSR